MERALIVVDVQKDFCEGGSLAVEGGNAVAARIASFLREHAGEYRIVVATRDWHMDPGRHFAEQPDYVDSWPVHCMAGTLGAEIHEAIPRALIARIVNKGEYQAAYSGFEGKTENGKTLEELLRSLGVEAVDVIGIATSHCVAATARDALRLGFRTTVLQDLCVGVTAEMAADALSDLRSKGVAVRLVDKELGTKA